MNRREFCLTAGLLASAPLFGGVVAARSKERALCFRAKKVFLDSWAAGIVRRDSPHAASFVRSQLTAIRHNGYDGLILIPGRCSDSEWLKRIELEADRMELAIFVPMQLTRDFLGKTQTVIPLAHEGDAFQSCVGKTANEGGFLLLNADDDAFGLVHYDASRCLWTGYASNSAGLVREAKRCEQDLKLTAARWLDHTRQSFL